jgi:hypothetical protein
MPGKNQLREELGGLALLEVAVLSDFISALFTALPLLFINHPSSTEER